MQINFAYAIMGLGKEWNTCEVVSCLQDEIPSSGATGDFFFAFKVYADQASYRFHLLSNHLQM